MTYHLFIDESGKFAEGLGRQGGRASVVGGVCGMSSAVVWESVHRACTTRFNEEHGTRFSYPTDFHCSPLLNGRTQAGLAVSIADLNAFVADSAGPFARAVMRVVRENSLFRFFARNDPGLYLYSQQATYGVNLVAALRAALDHLARSAAEVDRLEITIARRSIGETLPNPGAPVSADNQPYSADLMDFLGDQLPVGTEPGEALARRLMSAGGWKLGFAQGDKNPGLMAADFVCHHFWKHRQLEDDAPVVVRVDRAVLGNYDRHFGDHRARLLERGEYTAAAQFHHRSFPAADGRGAADFDDVIKPLRREKNPDLLARELPALLGMCRHLIAQRTVQPGALTTARSLLEALLDIGRRAASDARTDPRVRREWNALLVEALIEFADCVNHLGATHEQAAIEAELDEVLTCQGRRLPHTQAQRRELQFEARTRNLNALFNDYAFAEVIYSFEDVAKARQQEEEKSATDGDELLGKMQGSVGQAYAFLARAYADWSEEARRWFELSRRQFDPGTQFHAMSVNYLTTLAWQEGDLSAACAQMNEHPRLRPIPSPATLVGELRAYVAQPKASAFDIVNYLRLAALGVEANLELLPEELAAAVVHLEPRLHPEHPHEQVAKWLAYLFHLQSDQRGALRLCRQGRAFSEKSGFTLRTIAWSILGLEAVCHHAAGDLQTSLATATAFLDRQRELASESAHFRDYLADVGGAPPFFQGGEVSVARLMRLLPFTYA